MAESGADESGARSDQKKNPAAAYLDRLYPSGRRSMRRVLDRAVAVFTDEAVKDATAFDWSQIDLQQVKKLRSVMVARGAAAGTVNHMLSGVRSTVRIAWELGLVDDKTRINIENVRTEKPQRSRRAGRQGEEGDDRLTASQRSISRWIVQHPNKILYKHSILRALKLYPFRFSTQLVTAKSLPSHTILSWVLCELRRSLLKLVHRIHKLLNERRTREPLRAS